MGSFLVSSVYSPLRPNVPVSLSTISLPSSSIHAVFYIVFQTSGGGGYVNDRTNGGGTADRHSEEFHFHEPLYAQINREQKRQQRGGISGSTTGVFHPGVEAANFMMT